MNDGFVFLGHRIIRKRGPRGHMRPVTTILWEKYGAFPERIVKHLSGNYGMDLMESLNRQITGWAAFYQYTDLTATMFRKLDRTQVSARVQVADARSCAGARTGTGQDMAASRPE